MFKSILTVCIGNVCRSPMAEVLLADRLARRGIAAEVSSAGIAALTGRPAEPFARELVTERGLDLSGHRARQLTPELIRAHELILVMDAAQQHEVEAMLPGARGRVHRLGRWADLDIPDPFHRGREAFEEALALIERALDSLDRAWGPQRWR